MRFESVIGLEVHVQLLTKSKIFSGSSTQYGAQPNSQASAVDIALPGVLPVMNREALRMAIKFGLSIGAHINRKSQFARKNYFYPDPKGYQISQFDQPIVAQGELVIDIEGNTKTIGITRAHLEEDAGKSLHEDFHGMTGIDLNRAGTPLLEIVSEPDLRSANEAVAYLRQMHTLVRYLNICDGNMQEGSFRCDANVSIRKQGSDKLGTRTEIKNINSFRFVEKAINYEIERQTDVVESGGQVIQETRLYDPDKDETRSMRSKEEAHDYRYFPDPDLPSMLIEQSFIDEIASCLPEFPQHRLARFVSQFGLTDIDAGLLTQDKDLADYFEMATRHAEGDAKSVANWINGELTAQLNKTAAAITDIPVNCEQLGHLVKRINDNTISNKIARNLFGQLWDKPENISIDELIEQEGVRQITDSGAIEAMVDQIVDEFPDQVMQYRDGNQKIIGFLVGKIMKASRGKADPKQVNQLLRDKLS
jgi:aspartyl-tRNA(Asn)/glutamyl-tRNA(Gln) amidotransferase subunit B